MFDPRRFGRSGGRAWRICRSAMDLERGSEAGGSARAPAIAELTWPPRDFSKRAERRPHVLEPPVPRVHALPRARRALDRLQPGADVVDVAPRLLAIETGRLGQVDLG